MNATKIDWINHGIAFAASVIGIFIAFQLDDWQERRSRREQLDISLKGIKAEIEGNLNVFHQNDTALTALLLYTDFFFAHFDNGKLLCSERELEAARRENPGRLASVKYLSKVNDTLNRYSAHLNIDVVPYSGITTGNWDAARSSGILTYLDHRQVVLLSQVYDWTDKKLGVSDEEFHNNIITPDNNIDDLDKILHDYKLIKKVSQLKYQRMKQYYDQIKW